MDTRNIAQPALVTGATGFIGRALIARLLQEGVRVCALVLPGEQTDGVLPTTGCGSPWSTAATSHP